MNKKRVIDAVFWWVLFAVFMLFFGGKLSWTGDWLFMVIAIVLFLMAAIKTDECIDNEDILSKLLR